MKEPSIGSPLESTEIFCGAAAQTAAHTRHIPEQGNALTSTPGNIEKKTRGGWICASSAGFCRALPEQPSPAEREPAARPASQSRPALRGLVGSTPRPHAQTPAQHAHL